MNFSSEQQPQVALPQFSEINLRSNSIQDPRFSVGENAQAQNAVYTTATSSTQTTQSKQSLVNSPNKYPGTLFTWPDPNTILQLCEKQGLQAINIPNYQSNAPSVSSVQQNNLPLKIVSNPGNSLLSQLEINTKTDFVIKSETVENNASNNTLQSSAMAEYLQKLQATTIPLTLQQLIKFQSEQTKKEKAEDEPKMDQIQNNILNIPSIPVFRNSQIHNGNHFLNPSNPENMLSISPSDLNVHMEHMDEGNVEQQISKAEQQMQNEPVKAEKRTKFRAKTGEIKITVAFDGSTLYCCPECNLAFAEKNEADQHIQGHIQERKFQCKECGAMLKRREHLQQHVHSHSDERPFKCPVCQKAFKRNEHVTRHMNIHTGDKNFTCTVCQKAFSRKDHLAKHLTTHFGIKRSKTRKDVVIVDNKDSGEKTRSDPGSASKQDGHFKSENSLIQQLQNFPRDSTLIHTFSAFKEQAMKDGFMLPQQAVNMNEILPQNTRYLMPS